MNENYKLIDKQINEIKDLIELKHFLNKTFDNQINIKEKETFLDYLELNYLFNKKVRFEADKIKLDQLKTNFFNHFYLQAKLKIEFFENWIIEKRKVISEKPKVDATEKEIEHPFSSKTNFELFKYLDEWFKPSGKKAKYTYIFNHFKDNDFEPLLSQNTYLEFVMSFKNIKIADRLQGAPSNKIDAEINRLVSKFKKLNS